MTCVLIASLGQQSHVRADDARRVTVGTVRVGQAPAALAVDARTGHVFVVNRGPLDRHGRPTGSSNVTVLDASTGMAQRTIPLHSPAFFETNATPATAVNTRTGRLFIATSGTYNSSSTPPGAPGVISVLDTRTGALLGTVRLSQTPDALAVDERTNRVFTDVGLVLDGTTGMVVRRDFVVGDLLAIDARTNRVFVANALVGGCDDHAQISDSVCVAALDATTGALISKVILPQQVVGLAVDARVGRVIASMDLDRVNGGGPQLWLLDATTGRVVRRVACEGGTPLVVDTATSRAFTGSGSVVDTRSGRVIIGRSDISTDDEQVFAVAAVDEQVNRVFFVAAAANALVNTLAAGDGRSGRPSRQVTLGKGPPALAVDVQTFQDASGVVRVTQPITRYDDSGSPYVITPTEYLAQVPIATDSGADPAAPVNTGPATTSVVLTTANNAYLALNVDPAWLHDPHRVFPVTVDLPIATGSAYVDSGLAGSVNSCAPTTAAPPTDLVVGAENGCVYNGQAYFDLSSVPYDAPIASAALRLYTPNQTGATGVQLYQNAPPATGSDPAQPPSWSSAPAVVTSSAPIAQSGSTGHWQSWDVTGLVKQWARDGASNGGVTLQSAGTPVRFAGSLGTASADPSLAPYLDITYGPGPSGVKAQAALATTMSAPSASATPGPFNDGAQTIYGESGSYTIHGEAGMSQCSSAPHPDVTCPSIITGQYYGNLEPRAVKNKLGGQYIRFNAQLACPSYSQYGISTYAPGRVWWNTNFDNPLKDSNGKVVLDSRGNPIVSALNNEGDAGSIIVAAVKYDNEIPIIELTPNGGCPSDMKPLLWYKQAQDFVQYLYALIGTSRMVYFEIGNEPNGSSFRGYTDGKAYDGVDALDAKPGQKADGTYHYPDVFAAATHGIQSAVAQGSPYRILTGGMAAPTADRTRIGACQGTYYSSNIVVAGNAVREAGQPFSAQKMQAYNVPGGPTVTSANLGVAVHPYGYDTPGRYWKNFYTTYNAYDNNPQNPDPAYRKRHLNVVNNGCERLDTMLSEWRNSKNIPGNLPVILTETNWSSDSFAATPAEGTYLADLFTWMYDHDYLYHTRTPSNSPLRALVFRGADDASPDDLGIYQKDGGDKSADAQGNTSPGIPLPHCKTPAIKPGVPHSIAYDYYWLRYAACY